MHTGEAVRKAGVRQSVGQKVFRFFFITHLGFVRINPSYVAIFGFRSNLREKVGTDGLISRWANR